MCLNALETGQLEQVRQLAQVMLEQATLGQLAMLQGWAHYFLGMVHYCWNELDAASQHFTELVDKRYAAHTQTAHNGMIGLVRVHAARGDYAAAWQIMALLSQLDLDRFGTGRRRCASAAGHSWRTGRETRTRPSAGQMFTQRRCRIAC